MSCQVIPQSRKLRVSLQFAPTFASSDPMHNRRLCIVIPALNEEDAIGSTIQRCKDARTRLKADGVVEDVDIVVVSDGSTDRTPEIAKSHDDVTVIEFPQNRGYGAAIKSGWAASDADLLGFLDADGTCDPLFFKDLCQVIDQQSADIVLGSRMGPDSKMPPIRRLGNRIYALVTGILCGRSVTDTASGMRVCLRDAIARIQPLPDGLHFTPSMSARALSSGMAIHEIPMTYEERIGESKLSVVRDGIRFFETIFSGILCYRPDRLFILGFAFCLILVTLMGLYPTEFYFANGRVEEWMIYRFVACLLLGLVGSLLLSATAISHKMAALGPRAHSTDSFWASLVSKQYTGKSMFVLVLAYWLTAIATLWPGIVEYATSLTCTLHWSRLIVGCFFVFAGVQTLVTSILLAVVEMWRVQMNQREIPD